MMAHSVRAMPRFCIIAIVGQALLAGADIDFPAFSRDPTGEASHLRLLGGSSVDYFSTEFNELCPEIAGPITPPIGMSQRFEHAQRRDDPHYDSLPTFAYLDDGQLDNPFAGRMSFGEHTEVVKTIAFIPDDDLLPLPHNRTQLCHYALRLTQPVAGASAAAWFRFKQLVGYGFETEFHFSVLHRSRECNVAGSPAQWCRPAGGDGFAFVVQNHGGDAVGSLAGSNGYDFPNNLAVEFDMERDVVFGERGRNHISVHIPSGPGRSNSADHRISQIAYSSDIPRLQEGTHVARIAYDTKERGWDDVSQELDSAMRSQAWATHAAGRPGLLTVDLDGQRVIAVLVDLVHAARIDGMMQYQADPPVWPNTSAYDDAGATPGRAWVGFTSSTNAKQSQSVDILSWTFREKPRCPVEETTSEMLCRVTTGTEGREACIADGTPLCSFVVRNIGRQPLQFSARLSSDEEVDFHPCSGGLLEWDALHPYFLGCRRVLRFTHALTELWIGTLDGSRTTMVTEPYLLGRAPTPFRREQLFQYCIKEHKHDPARLYFAECNCDFCVRVLDMQAYYTVFYSHLCMVRYGPECPCFEVSTVTPDITAHSVLEPMAFMRLHTCRGCSYTSQCALMLKMASCEIPEMTYIVGNPLAPEPLNNGFQDLVRDDGRVPEGRISGDGCDCEPDLSPYKGGEDGRAGQCRVEFQLDDPIQVPDLAGCTAKCQITVRCAYMVYWPDGECRVYSDCLWDPCTTYRCYEAFVYRVTPLGNYMDTRGEVQRFLVFPQRSLYTTREACFTCLQTYEDEFCIPNCGTGREVPYLHWPGGQSCGTCIFAGNRFHELTLRQTRTVKACVQESTRQGGDPWIDCEETVQQQGDVSTLDLFNGVSTHYLSECPGRDFEEAGAVCVPNTYARDYFPLQVLSRMAAKENKVWDWGMECLNALCQIVPRSDCYSNLGRWLFNFNLRDDSQQIHATNVGGALIRGGAVNIRKDVPQYVYTDPLPFAINSTTLVMYVQVANSQAITNLAEGKYINTTSSWEEDFLPGKAVDGDMTTYWSSQLGEAGNMDFTATWETDLGRVSSVGQIDIYWYQHAADFEIRVSRDRVTWQQVYSIQDNTATSIVSNNFFKSRYVQVVMTKAAAVRPAGPGQGLPVYSIYEFEALVDDNLSRLRNTLVSHSWQRTTSLAHDGDLQTYWSVMPSDASAYIRLDFGSVQASVTTVRVHWHVKPQEVVLLWGLEPCSVAAPYHETSRYVGVQVPDVIEDTALWSGQCYEVRIDRGSTRFGEWAASLAEVELYKEEANLALTSSVYYTSPLTFLNAATNAIDGNIATNWLLRPVSSLAILILDLGQVYPIISMMITWTTGYLASQFRVGVGMDPNTFTTVYDVPGSVTLAHRFVLDRVARYVELRVTQIPLTNSGGLLGLDEFVVYAASDNIARRNSTVSSTNSEWAACGDCHIEVDGAVALHEPPLACDGDVDTWWGAPFGILQPVSWEVQFDTSHAIDLIALRWKYPAKLINVWCAFSTSVAYSLVSVYDNNDAYMTVIVFASTRTCQMVRIFSEQPLDTIANEPVLGIREVEIYSTAVNIARNRPAVASDGTNALLATDPSVQTKWVSASTVPTNLTVDLGSTFNAWGARFLWSSGELPRSFDVSASLDGTSFQVIKKYELNFVLNVYMVLNFTARYLRLQLYEGGFVYGLREFAVYTSPNLALGRPLASASQGWDHIGSKVADGNNATFWVSEPFASEATLQIDLEASVFVAAGVHILWKFPAQSFAVYFAQNNTNESDWSLLYETYSNTNNYTRIDTDFEARYVELRMRKPAYVDTDPVYGIYSFDVLFDSNLAHGKNITSTHVIDDAIFRGASAIDDDSATIWMPPQNTDRSSLVLDLLQDFVVSGFECSWRLPPVEFTLWAQETNGSPNWFIVAKWTAAAVERTVPFSQVLIDGFFARRLRIDIEQTYDGDEGKIVALRSVLVQTAGTVNLALNKPVEFSAEIPGNPAAHAVDGHVRTTYWSPGETFRAGWIIVDIASPENLVVVGRMTIWWRRFPGTFNVEFFREPAWSLVYNRVNTEELVSDFYLVREMWRCRVNIFDLPHEIGISELAVYEAITLPPPAVGESPEGNWTAPVTHMNDYETQTYWMSPSHTGQVNIRVDLGRVYPIFDIFIWFGFLTQGFDLFVSETLASPGNEVLKLMTSTPVWGLFRLQDRNAAFNVRYLRLFIIRGYEDPEFQLGTSIRDIAIYQFRNLARDQQAIASTVWNFPASWSVDGNADTFWLSRFGASEAELVIDFAEVKNFAGFSLIFGEPAEVYRVSYSEDGLTYAISFSTAGNFRTDVDIGSEAYHFRARYVKIFIARPLNQIDPPGWPVDAAGVFSIKELRFFEHPGGGGAVGIQSLDGSQYNTITFGQHQPGEWILGSENDIFTRDLDGGHFPEDVGSIVQIAVTFQEVQASDASLRSFEIAMYRNGLPYGAKYIAEGPASRLMEAHQTRLVLGVRSTFYPDQPENVSRVAANSKHGLTHSPYFDGKVFNVTIIQNPLSPEEIHGLYEARRGGTELGCHCFEACPVGMNRFFPAVPVPCSGQGVCLRNRQGVPMGPGTCLCMPGFSGEACQNHCSQISVTGCCATDDDCPPGVNCNPGTKACMDPPGGI